MVFPIIFRIFTSYLKQKNNMTVSDIKSFLREKRGYIKEGGGRLAYHLKKKGFSVTVKDCKQALKEMRKESKIIPVSGDKSRILLYDIETAYGLARVWRPGWKVRVSYDDFVKHPSIICISYKWSDSDEVHNLRWNEDTQCDKQMVKLFVNEMNKADALCGHNGDKFDLPWIKTRAVFHGIKILPRYKTIDTLKIARYQFKFPTNRLDDLGDYLGVGRKIKTDRSLWVDTVCNGDKKALDKMCAYCNQDVLLLEDVYNKLKGSIAVVTHNGVNNGEEKFTSPYVGGTKFTLVKTTTTKAGTIKHLMHCTKSDRYFDMSNASYRKYLKSLNK